MFIEQDSSPITTLVPLFYTNVFLNFSDQRITELAY